MAGEEEDRGSLLMDIADGDLFNLFSEEWAKWKWASKMKQKVSAVTDVKTDFSQSPPSLQIPLKP